MYSISEKTQSEKGSSKFFDAGIIEGVFIESLSYEKSDAGYESLNVVIKNSDGTTLQQKYFEPKEGMYTDTKEKLQLEVERFCGVMKNIASKFLGEDYVLAGKKTFKEFVESVLKDIGKKYEGVELRTKLTYDKKGYLKLPKYAPVFELTTLEKTNFFIGKKDVLERPVKPDAEIQEEISKNAKPEDELLF